MLESVLQWSLRHHITRQAGHRRLKTHGIPIINGKVDGERADAIWEATVDPKKQNRGPAARKARKAIVAKLLALPSAHPAILDPAKAPIPPEIDSLSKAQLRREVVRLEKEVFLLSKMKGEVVKVSEVQNYVSGMISECQSRLLRIPSQLRDRLAQEADPVVCGDLLDDTIRHCLTALSEYQPDAA